MYKYIMHGEVGIIRQDSHEEILPYHDIETQYESKIPLDVKDPAHFALAVLLVKESYLQKVIAKGHIAKIGDQKFIIDVMSAGITEIEPTPPIEVSTTARGFTILRFKDTHYNECSLQKSSAGSGDKIWFGISHPKPVQCIQGQGWIAYPLPDNVDVPTRMHLNQEQTAKLLPYLEHFVRTGELL